MMSLNDDPTYGFYVVMKFINGKTLDVYRKDYIAEHGRFPLAEAVRILWDVARALDYSHERKVLHRDVKPQNIMVSPEDGVQLIDFGLAAEIRSSMMQVSETPMDMAGTRPYMAPEQWRGRLQDAKTDQYALAVTAYELIVGRQPFQGTDVAVLRECVLNETPEPISGISEHINAALAKALSKKREDRFPDCRSFIKAMAEKPMEPETAEVPPPADDFAVFGGDWIFEDDGSVSVDVDDGPKLVCVRPEFQDMKSGEVSVDMCISEIDSNKELFRSDVIKDHGVRPLELDVGNVETLELIVDPNGSIGADNAIWFTPMLTQEEAQPVPEIRILSPKRTPEEEERKKKAEEKFRNIPDAKIKIELGSGQGSGSGQFTPDGKKFVAPSRHQEPGAHLFDIATGKQLLKLDRPYRLLRPDCHPDGGHGFWEWNPPAVGYRERKNST